MIFKSFVFSFILLFLTLVSMSCEKGQITECENPGLGLISYSGQVQPIIMQSCAITGCHGMFNEAPFQLLTHFQVDSVAMFGDLMFAIKHQSPFPMPRIDPMIPEAYKLPDSLINIIDCWVNQGRRNN